MANLHVITVSKGAQVCRVINNQIKGTTKTMVYEPLVDSSVTGSNRINCLSIVVATMRQLSEAKFGEGKDIATMYTLGLVVDLIHNGTFKHWVLNDSKKLDGTDVTTQEMELWTEFVTLYKEMFMNINFKNVSTLSLPSNPKYRVTADQIALSKLVAMAWEKAMPVAPTIEEAEGL